MLFICALVLSAVSIGGATEGVLCSHNGNTGVCRNVRNCPPAIQDIKNKNYPKVCSFIKTDPIVCCIILESTPAPDLTSIVTSSVPPTKVTTEYVPSVHTEYDKQKRAEKCMPMPPEITPSKTGQKAWDKCIEYQELVYPCVKPLFPSGVPVPRQNRCHHHATELIYGGLLAGRHEYPHAALLGYGNNSAALVWLCGGSLISDKFILTAAHCKSSREYGEVTYAALHTLNRAAVSPTDMHRIRRIINHPQYKLPRRYHDIGLLELDVPVVLDSFTVPACLYTGVSDESILSDRAIATSWSTNDILETGSTLLQKIYLTKFTPEECSRIYPDVRWGGYNDTTQICYGDKTQSKNICQDDGGNSLLVENKRVRCMYSLVGVTSYGMGCLSHSPGVYSRVEAYVSWIESVVWP